jgi:uncharacterized membrane protein
LGGDEGGDGVLDVDFFDVFGVEDGGAVGFEEVAREEEAFISETTAWKNSAA